MERRGMVAVALILLGLLAMLVALLETASRADASVHSVNCRVILHRAILEDGRENQPGGVTRAAEYGWAEVDASVTKDGFVIGVHDARLGRLTGGASREYVSDLTYEEIRALPHPKGKFRLTTTLIARAAKLDTPIMVTINRWRTIKKQGYAQQTLDLLHTAAQAHPRPGLVFIGGFGAQDAMRAAHPEQATFWRYENTDSRDWIVENAETEGVDLVALPKKHHVKSLVNRLRELPVSRITTRQMYSREAVRAAQAAGIQVMQHNNPKRVATKWCR